MRKRPYFKALAFAGLLLPLAALACRPSQTVERQTDDAATKAKIKTKLASEVNISTLTQVDVNVTNGVATLAGPVSSETEKQQVEAVVRSVEGVVSVNNNLQIVTTQVITPEPAATPQATPAPS